MPGIARQFEPQMTRSGGAPSKFRFTIRCSDCAKTDAYEASRPTSDDTVKSFFNNRGWLLGRAPAYDLCPACLARPRQAQEVKSSNLPQREPAASGKPEELAAEVFRSKDANPPQAVAPKAPQPTHPTPAPSSEVEQALAGMAADLKGLRSAVELVAEQMNKLVALGGQQIEAIARLAPALVRSSEGLSGSLRQVASALQMPPRWPLPMAQPQPEAEGSPEPTQGVAAKPTPGPRSDGQEPSRRARGKRQSKAGGQIASAPIVVKSIADAKRADRFYTSIRLPREVWEQAGFGPDDRLLLDWSGKALTIERTVEGGVKPKSINDSSVVLQSWKLGNLNFDQLRVTGGSGSLRLTAGSSQRA
ncbi:hypothetical protein [Microvirga sp. M2]|uniref:hypothetical protein n=1 Tax=Microvirga sp. M2 TaxID=3073270 RepID=UPI0039C269C8